MLLLYPIPGLRIVQFESFLLILTYITGTCHWRWSARTSGTWLTRGPLATSSSGSQTWVISSSTWRGTTWQPAANFHLPCGTSTDGTWTTGPTTLLNVRIKGGVHYFGHQGLFLYHVSERIPFNPVLRCLSKSLLGACSLTLAFFGSCMQAL